MRDLPTGTVTFLFTDVEGSTRLLHELGDRYADVLAEHRRVLRDAFAQHGGVEVDTQGDAFFFAFARASDALAAAAEAREALADGPVRVRMGVHTGEPVVTDEGYVGIDVHRAARIAAVGHGGQILVSQATRELCGADALRDLGEHRLKDLTAPERLYQLGEGEFPPLKSLNNSNLPVPAEPLIGRKKELADLRQLLRDGARVVTITGPGGIGKTRLALDVAAGVIECFTHGVWWVDLAPVRDAKLVLPTIAAAMGAKADLDVDLRGKQLLLLLDNVEQVADAAADLARLQRSCSGLSLLSTSREPLHIAGEREYPLSPLSEAPAAELLRQRAEAVSPDFQADYAELVEVCNRLDRLPLAIELAAARTKAIPLRRLLERLDRRLPLLETRRRDVEERQRTLRATIDWSYELLDSAEQAVFRKLSVFVGSFDLEAALAVCEADLDALESLVDKSLLRHTDSERFFMLDTIREFAAERLNATPSPRETTRAHAMFFLLRAEAVHESDDGSAIVRLFSDYPNLRAALDWAGRENENELGLRLAAALGNLWCERGPIAEGRAWLEHFLQKAAPSSPRLVSQAQRSSFRLAYAARDIDGARRAAKEEERLSEALRDDRLRALALRHRADVAEMEGDLSCAKSLNEESLAVARHIADSDTLLGSLINLSNVLVELGELDDADALAQEALEVARNVDDVYAAAIVLGNLGWISVRRGDEDEARRFFRDCIPLARSLELLEVLHRAIGGIAATAASINPERAGRLLGAAEALHEQIGSSLEPAAERNLATILRTIRSRIGESRLREARAEGRSMTVDDAVELALRDLD